MLPASRRSLTGLRASSTSRLTATATTAFPNLVAARSSSIYRSQGRTLLPTTLSWASAVGIRDFSRCATLFEAAAAKQVQGTSPILPEDDAQAEDAKPSGKPFTDLKGSLAPPLYQALTAAPFHYKHMSSVQEAVLSLLPDISEPLGSPASPGSTCEPGSDLLVKAKTGTGKTLAFLVPAVEARLRDVIKERERFMAENPSATDAEVRRHVKTYRRNTSGVLILSPTRELATQIANEAVRLCSHLNGVDVRLFVGGSSKAMQLRDWNRGSHDIIVATPGRMWDVLESVPDVAEVVGTTKTLIFDEADTLLEMGFKDEIDRIVSRLRPKAERQTFLFSATVSREIQKIARSTMKSNPKFIDCVPEGETNVHEHVPQHYTVLRSADEQLPHIFRLLAEDQLLHPDGGKAIVFLPTTKLTQLFAQVLNQQRSQLPWGYLTGIHEIHGQRSQDARIRAATAFRKAKDGYQILVTSDVSARGVDYPGVTRVIQVGIPTSREIYIHRVGRTGRAGKSGRGDLVLLPWEVGYIGWQLGDLPLKALPVDQTGQDLSQLATAFDESIATGATKPPVATADMRGGSRKAMQTPVSVRLERAKADLEENILPQLADDVVRDSFSSLCGYYIAKAADMRTSKEVVLQGLKDWAVGALALEQEPYVSPAFLMKMGFNNRQRSQGFGRGGGSGSRWGGGSSRGFGGRRDGPSDRGFGGQNRDGRARGRGWGGAPREADADNGLDGLWSSEGSSAPRSRFGSRYGEDGERSRPRDGYRSRGGFGDDGGRRKWGNGFGRGESGRGGYGDRRPQRDPSNSDDFF